MGLKNLLKSIQSAFNKQTKEAPVAVKSDQSAVQSILDNHFDERFKFELSGLDEPDIHDAHEKLKAVGQDKIDAYIVENKVPHVFNIFEPSFNLLRNYENAAGKEAGVCREYFDACVSGSAEDVEKAQEALRGMIMDTGRASDQDAREYIANVGGIAEELKTRLLGESPEQSPELSL